MPAAVEVSLVATKPIRALPDRPFGYTLSRDGGGRRGSTSGGAGLWRLCGAFPGPDPPFKKSNRQTPAEARDKEESDQNQSGSVAATGEIGQLGVDHGHRRTPQRRHKPRRHDEKDKREHDTHPPPRH